MQVKKFEARTMKEALELVKTQLGPDAIILSARDNNKSFGLVGEGSVEITAAVSEETLQRKRFAESRLADADREKFQKSTARAQKDLIEKMVSKHVSQAKAPNVTQRRYIDIEDENEVPTAHQVTQAAEQRIRNAAQRAWSAMQEQERDSVPKKNAKRSIPLPTREEFVASALAETAKAVATATGKTPAPMVAATAAVKPALASFESEEVRHLRNEIASLKQVITQFQSVPQSFAGSHPGADYGLSFDLSFMFEKLTQAGVADDIAAEILTQAQETIPAIKIKNKALVDGWVARHILETTKVAGDQKGVKIHCFVGPAGAGKTSSMVKLASQLVVRENKKIAILTADTYKVGAVDQMRIYAQILNVPFSVLRQASDWTSIMRYLANLDAVLVDYTGLSLKSAEEITMLKNLLPPSSLNAKTHLVLPATAKDQDAQDLGRRYSVLGYQDVIFTDLDESVQHGTIYNFMRRFDVPLHSFGIGPRVPEDFEFATKERVLDLIFKITKVNEQEMKAV